MPDREKVIKWADICLSSAYSEKCNECPYQINHEGLYSCVEGILRDAIALLKEDVSKTETTTIVRCKDCLYWQDNNDGYPHIGCKWREDETPDPYDFCSAGERREE